MTLPIIRGFEKDFDFIKNFFDIQYPKDNFPKSSIYIDENNDLVFNFALAGYSKQDFQITQEGDKLTIIGRKETNPLQAKQVFKNQIAYRDFKVEYHVPLEYVDSETSANLENGILEVRLVCKEKVQTKLIDVK